MTSRTAAVRARLQAAAVELYSEEGYDRTTVASIASRAGVTERTYFRHFADKREVLFAAEDQLADALRSTAAQASPADLPAALVAGQAVMAVARLLQPTHDALVVRERIVVTRVDLRERERGKLIGWQQVLGQALEDRGTTQADAQLVAAIVIAVLDVTARSWIAGPSDVDLASSVRAALDRARLLSAPFDALSDPDGAPGAAG
jgi:AcrR family transcriptional regulator